MSKIVRVILGLVLGFVIGAATGATLIFLFSGNVHDKGLEMTMTAAFATGPLGAVLGLISGLMWKRSPQMVAGQSRKRP